LGLVRHRIVAWRLNLANAEKQKKPPAKAEKLTLCPQTGSHGCVVVSNTTV